MTAIEIYEKETGNKQPSNQISYHEWHIEYVKWLEQQVVKFFASDREQSLNWWRTLNYDTKYHWFTEYCNRFTRNLNQIYDNEIEEIWIDNIKNSN